jgi:hypothetical protein
MVIRFIIPTTPMATPSAAMKRKTGYQFAGNLQVVKPLFHIS